MQVIPPDRLASFTEYFADPQAAFVLASIMAGNTNGQLWQHAQAESSALLLWDQGNNVFYLSGQFVDGHDMAFQQLIESNIKPAAITKGLSHYKVRALNASWEQAMSRVFAGLSHEPLSENLYLFKKPSIQTIPAASLPGTTYTLIDAPLLKRTDLKNLANVREEIAWMWPSLERFYEHGFGSIALLKDEIICWCTAEYVSQRTCGIGIETVRAQQNQGIATATAAHFVAHALQRNIRPYWECWRDNIGSVRVAEKVGFEKIQESLFWSGVFAG